MPHPRGSIITGNAANSELPRRRHVSALQASFDRSGCAPVGRCVLQNVYRWCICRGRCHIVPQPAPQRKIQIVGAADTATIHYSLTVHAAGTYRRTKIFRRKTEIKNRVGALHFTHAAETQIRDQRRIRPPISLPVAARRSASRPLGSSTPCAPSTIRMAR